MSATFQEKLTAKFSAVALENYKAKPDPKGAFVVFVDGMDGDVYGNWIKATSAVTYAFKNGAESVTLKKFK